MWFADTGQGLSWALMAGWLLAVVLAVIGSRTGNSGLGRVLPPAVRLPVAIGSGVAAVLVVVQAGLVDTVADGGGAGLLDRSVLSWFVAHRGGVATTAMAAVSALGGTVGMAVLAVLAASLLWWFHRCAEAVVVVVATAGAGVLVTGFKNLYGRARPPEAYRLSVETNASLPSGHALGSIVVLGVLAAVVVILWRRTAVQVTAVATAVVGIVAVAVSRLYLGVHWVTDILTGWALGGAWLALCVTTLVLIQHRRRGTGSGAPTITVTDVDRDSAVGHRTKGPRSSPPARSPRQQSAAALAVHAAGRTGAASASAAGLMCRLAAISTRPDGAGPTASPPQSR